MLSLLNANPDIQCSILAGLEGLNREIVTITSIESPKSVEKLMPGTLVMSAGVLFEGENLGKLSGYIELLIKQGCVGLGLKTRFIQHVPPTVLTLANMNGFTVFSLPDDFIWSDFFSIFYSLKYEGASESRILDPSKNSVEALRRLSQYGPQFVNMVYVEMIRLPAVITDGRYHILARNQEDQTDSIADFLADGRDRIVSSDERTPFGPVGSFRSINYKNHRVTDVILSGDAHLLMEHTGKNLTHDEIELLKFNYSNLLRSGQPYLSDEDVANQLLRDLVTSSPILNLNDLIARQELQKSAYVILYVAGMDPDAFIVLLQESFRRQRSFLDARFFPYPLEDRNCRLCLCAMNTALADTSRWVAHFGQILLPLDLAALGIRLYCGDPVTFVGDIQYSYQQATLCMRYGERLWPSEHMLFYHNTDCLAALETNGVDLEEIERLDRAITSFNACETLEAVLEHKMLKQAANAIYIHENTMRYRIGKIQQALNMDIDSSHIALNLLVKLKLYKLLRSTGNRPPQDPP